MSNKLSTILLSAIFSTFAYSCATPQPVLDPATLPTLSPQPVVSIAPSIIQEESTSVGQESSMDTTILVPGLRVIYIRDGNLWSWTELGGIAQLTNTADMSSIRVSADGQVLAFMRGREVWTVRMDGTDARLVVSQAEEGGALWFAPNGSQLAISARDHIDIIDINTGSKNSVLTYPSIPADYYPEVVWMPDSTGFKTVIPASTKAGQAELMFIFTDGTVASLAKFSMVQPVESAPFLSPDGGYVIYVASFSNGKEVLHLMDSSGATLPYGEPADSVRAFGWLPDSRRFAYAWENPAKVFMGAVGNQAIEIPMAGYSFIRWVNDRTYLALQDGDLSLNTLAGTRILIDAPVTEIEIVPVK